MYTVSELNRYPIKSMGRVSLTSATIDRFGIQHDRRWMLIDERNRFLTQRKITAMAAIVVTECHDKTSGRALEIAIDGKTIKLSTHEHLTNDTVMVKVWQDECEAYLASNEVNQWLSDRLGVACRLVYMADDYVRRVDEQYALAGETVSFADGFPLLLTTEASLGEFNGQLSRTIDMVRFRPNLVVSGNAPYEEDHWKRIRVGAVEFLVVKPCSRCVMPTINPQTLEKEPDVFKTLKAYRSAGRDVFFGQNLLPIGEGEICVGDSVEILA